MSEGKLNKFRTKHSKTNELHLKHDRSLSYSKKSKTNYILNNLVSFVIYLITFFCVYYLKRQTLILEGNYSSLLGLLSISLIVGSILSNKFILTKQHELWQIFRKLCISLILSLGFLSIALLLYNISDISRGLIIGMMFSGLIIESLYYYLLSDRRKRISIVERARVSINYLLIDLIILSLFCYLEIINILNINLREEHFIMLGVIYLSWFLSAATTHKFQPVQVAISKWNAFSLQIKFYLLIASMVLLSIFLLQINSPEWGYFLTGVVKYSIVSGLLAFILFAEKIKNKTDEATTLFLKAYELKEPTLSNSVITDVTKYGFSNTQVSESIVKQKLQFEYLKEYGNVFTFLNRMLELKSFDTRKTLIIRSVDPFNVKVLQPESQQLIVNLHALNDQSKMNNYLLEVNKKLVNGGVFAGSIIPNKNRYRRFIKRYPFIIANIFYLIDFIWKRAFPKLPLTRKIYSVFSKGKDRALSLAEGLGRLVYCGFEILDLTEINDEVYFVAVKRKESNTLRNLYYSPIFKMKRIGEGGKVIYVYKFRTMHPYSELIQNFVYLTNKMNEGGKFKDDFRIPAWGKFIRSVWIDELPMIYNWFKRDLKLVGVRPLSTHYLSLYSQEHQQRRKNFKPGLVPPYYADMPKTINEIELSEKKYFDAYQLNPFKSDFKYFLKIVSNILFKEKRSA